MGKIQLGIALPNGMRDKARRSEYGGKVQEALDIASGTFDSAWIVDHFQVENNDVLEGWTMVSYLAALNPAFQWGHAVICQSFRNPALLAKMVATLQFISGGRFIFGVGAGWKEDEYISYGYDFPSAGVRVEQLDETLQIVKAMWTEPHATFHGKHYHIEEAVCEPRPDPLPAIMIGGSKPRMLRVIARHADWWNVSWTSIEDYRPQVAECERACAEVGRDVASLRRTWFGGCAVGRTEEEVLQLTHGHMKAGNAFVGTPAQVVEQMRPFVELGVDYFMLGVGGFPDLTTVELLKNEVYPALQEMADSSSTSSTPAAQAR